MQIKSFIGSYTSLLKESTPRGQTSRVLAELGIEPSTFKALPRDPDVEADHIFLLRHTLMNPWLLSEDNGRNYIDRYWDYLVGLIEAELVS